MCWSEEVIWIEKENEIFSSVYFTIAATQE